MIKKYTIEQNKLTESEKENSEVWVFTNPDDEERKLLCSEFGLDEYTVVSALDPDELARLESENEALVLIYKIPKNYSAKEHFLFKVGSVGMALRQNRLAIISSEDLHCFEGKRFQSVRTPMDVLLNLIFTFIRHYIDHLKVINMTTDEIERKISVSMENRHLLNLFSLEKSLVYYLNAINSNGYALEKLKHHGIKHQLSEQQKELLEDIIIENNQCYRQAEIYSNILAGLMDARVSIVSNNLNILMKNLTLVTIGIMVPTLIVSVFSMNVTIPMEKHPYAFWMVIALAVISVIGVMVGWKMSSLRERGRRS